jgi:hypothetical protein
MGVGGGASSGDHKPRKWGQFRLSYPLARSTVRRYVLRAAEVGLGWPLPPVVNHAKSDSRRERGQKR